MPTKTDHVDDGPHQAQAAAGDPTADLRGLQPALSIISGITRWLLAGVFDRSVEKAKWYRDNSALSRSGKPDSSENIQELIEALLNLHKESEKCDDKCSVDIVSLVRSYLEKEFI
jgi:hypothetical protein